MTPPCPTCASSSRCGLRAHRGNRMLGTVTDHPSVRRCLLRPHDFSPASHAGTKVWSAGPSKTYGATGGAPGTGRAWNVALPATTHALPVLGTVIGADLLPLVPTKAAQKLRGHEQECYRHRRVTSPSEAAVHVTWCASVTRPTDRQWFGAMVRRSGRGTVGRAAPSNTAPRYLGSRPVSVQDTALHNAPDRRTSRALRHRAQSATVRDYLD